MMRSVSAQVLLRQDLHCPGFILRVICTKTTPWIGNIAAAYADSHLVLYVYRLVLYDVCLLVGRV
jgi:hypothetical protein